MEALKQAQNITPSTLTPEHVRGLSFHEVTSRYGTHGLHVRLEDALKATGLFEEPNVQDAMYLGLLLHSEDSRTNGHYTDHLMRVTLRIIERFGITSEAIISAAMLHDAVEDHAQDILSIFAPGSEPSDETEAAIMCLQGVFGKDVARIIRVVTNPPFNEDSKQEEYAKHTKHLVLTDPEARILKLSDFIDNAVGNHYTATKKRHELDEKYLPLFPIHMSGLYMPDSLITGDAKVYALRSLVRGQQRARARLLGRISSN
jgi:(p)ppGpp synthase/HD superfamily hydrolase